jgi:hypothetical protein
MNGVTLPLRANNSQAKDAGAEPEHGIEAFGALVRQVARLGGQRRLVFYSRHRSNHCMRS